MEKAILKLNNENSDYIIFSSGEIYSNKTHKYLKGNINNQGYKVVTLTHNKKKKGYSLHRLVAETFLDNPNNLPAVNHIDGNKQNNNISNLEIINKKQNALHSNYILNKNVKPVLKYLDNGEIIEYPSLSYAARENKITPSGILYAINNHSRTKNSFWEYK